MDNRPRLHYAGKPDLDATLGPTMLGELLTIAEVEPNPAGGWTAIFRNSTTDDVLRARAQFLRVETGFGATPVLASA